MSLNKISINDTTTVNTGVVYDISKATSQSYDSLSAALGTNGNNVPPEVRDGGMSIRFISNRNSDNKYVQYRYIGTEITGTPNPFLDTANWQGVDTNPTADSRNLVESGGVKALFDSQYGDGAGDFSVVDENSHVIVVFEDGHIKTKEFNSSVNASAVSRGMMSATDKAKLDTIEEGAQVNETNVEANEMSDFSIKDESNYAIVRFVGGHVKTKNFDSAAQTSKLATIEEGAQANETNVGTDTVGDLNLSDEDNNIIASFALGHIKTKNFNSKDVIDTLVELGNAIDGVEEELEEIADEVLQIPYSIAMFESVAFCGDSYVKGQIYNAGSLVGDKPNLSWGKCIGRLCGVNASIYASSGADTNTWQSRSDCLPAALAASPSGLYVFCLGINDSTYVTLGSMSDITNYESYTDYPNTFYGNYGKIIEQIEAHAPNSIIILMTPCHPNYIARYKTPIMEITTYYGIAMIDTSKSKLIMSSDYKSHLSGGHPTAALHGALALDIINMISDCIRNNYTYFKSYVGL